MNDFTIIIISSLVAIALLLIQRVLFQKKIITESQIQKENLIAELIQMKKNYDSLILSQFDLQNAAYKDGLTDGEAKNKLTIRVEPIENYTGNNYYLWSTEKIEIGFEYTLLINGTASEYKSMHIIKSVKTSKVNEENVNTILNGLEQIENLNPSIFLVSSSFKIIKDNFLKQIRK